MIYYKGGGYKNIHLCKFSCLGKFNTKTFELKAVHISASEQIRSVKPNQTKPLYGLLLVFKEKNLSSIHPRRGKNNTQCFSMQILQFLHHRILYFTAWLSSVDK